MSIASRSLLGLSAVILAGGAVIHALALPKAAAAAAHSTLAAFFVGAFKGLWACDSISSFGLALALGAIASFPSIAARSLVIILALPLFGFTVALFATMGNFFPTYLNLAAAVATLAGGLLHPRVTSGRISLPSSAGARAYPRHQPPRIR